MSISPYQRLTDHWWPRSCAPRPCDRELVVQVNKLGNVLHGVPDNELASRTAGLRARRLDCDGRSRNQIAELFALVREATRRTLGFSHYDVQVLAGLAQALGAVAEMQTGEGKTLVGTLSASMLALSGRGIHVATVNQYLAKRDFQALRPIYEMLGFTVGLALDGASLAEKRAAYECDITYVTGYELGFDYLRDQIAIRGRERLPLGKLLRHSLHGSLPPSVSTAQRGHAVAIIDEIDSVLIDEATTPLVLSAPRGESVEDDKACHLAKRLASEMQSGRDYIIEQRSQRVSVTQAGADRLHEVPGRQRLHLIRPWKTYIEQALRAEHVLTINVDYVVRDDTVQIVDQNTGRIFSERTWRDGLHQAVEAKENVPITQAARSVARISRQQYFQNYSSLGGMTGTAQGHEHELLTVYDLPIVVIPLRRPSLRQHLPNRCFTDVAAKWEAVVAEVAERHAAGQPILLGTRTISSSQQLANCLQTHGLPFELLNGIQHADEAELIANAGQLGAITIATNMAGRGTDIKLSDASRAIGGLHVIACERNDSQRIDRQLIGRGARQGDPGSCRFYTSADDDLITRYAPRFQNQLRSMANASGEIVGDFDATMAKIQQTAESRRLQQRQEVMRQALWMNDVLETVA